MKKLYTSLFALLFIILSSPSHAAEKVVFGTFPIPLMVIDQNNGVFVELTKAIAKRAGLDIKIVVTPPKRTISNFLEGKNDAIFPGLDVTFPPNTRYARSKESIFVKVDFVFTKKGAPMLTSIKDLEGKKVGITAGYPYVRELLENKKIMLDTAGRDEYNVNKLVRGRFAAFVVEEKAGLTAFRTTGFENDFQYDPKSPISKQDVFFAFQNSEKGQQFADIISKALSSMKKDGTFGRIMQKAK